MSNSETSRQTSRRAFIRRSVSALTGAGLGAGILPLTSCDTGSSAKDKPSTVELSGNKDGPVREITLTASPNEVEVGADQTYRTWLYNGQLPGPEIRAKEGERLRITVENRLPDAGTTVHWHGLPVPNSMDGVPGVTQEAIPSGGSMTYEFEAAPAGSYMYHSHQGLQLDRGLIGPLIIEERTPHVDYDREHTVILDDFLPGTPQTLEERTAGREGMMDEGGMMDRDRRESSGRRGGMMDGDGCSMMNRDGGEGRRGGGMMGNARPPYEGLLINGKLPSAPATFDVKRGERVRLRLINPSSATTYHLAIAGHRMTVSHADGRPIEPVEVDSLTIGMGERYDVIVEANAPGAHSIVARPVEGKIPPARAVLNYRDSRKRQPPEGEVPEGLRGGRRLRYRDLQSIETTPGRSEPNRTFDLRLSGGMMMQPDVWTIDGQAYPDADPLKIEKGDRVRVNMSNMSMMLHPMHLHGHFFRTGNAIKDTVLVEPHMGRASFEFTADNPGDWYFHCHNLYHLHAGMAREFRYM